MARVLLLDRRLWCRRHLFALMACVLSIDLAVPASDVPNPVRVGVADNPPVVFKNARGRAAGIAIDVLEQIARKERWRLEYVYAPWNELLVYLNDGHIHVLAGMGASEERRRLYRLTQEPLIGNWGIVYKAPGAPIVSPLDLEQRRIALMTNSVHSEALIQLLADFRVRFVPVYVPTYKDALDAVNRGVADAGVVNRLFGNENAARYRIDPTGIVFNPVYVHYATRIDADPAIIDTLDRHLRELKQTPNSPYYRSLAYWLADGITPMAPAWLAWAAASLLILLAASMYGTGVMRKRLRIHAQALARHSTELATEIAQRRLAQQRLAEAALRDDLTDLPNRAACARDLPVLLREADGLGTPLAVLILDMDRFKGINESLGHAAGDALLREATRRLQGQLLYRDHLYRFSGDEFVVVACSTGNTVDLGRLAERLLQELRRPFDIEGRRLYVSASIGISRYPDDERDPQELLKNADIAMRHAKHQGRNRYCLYARDMTEQVRSLFLLGTRLRRAVTERQLSLHYQPVVALDSGEVVGLEALLRWDDPELGLQLPDVFVPYAEESGLIEPLGAWALNEACTQIQRLRANRARDLRLYVNVSARQLESKHFISSVIHAVDTCGLPPQTLELEVTESVLLRTSRDVSVILNALKNAGARLAIDDFGIGYSSLSYLTRLPIDTLKIDRSFVARLPDPRDSQITTTILAMGQKLGLEVIAEGIEQESQMQLLREQGCKLGQGFLIARPMPLEAIEEWLSAAATTR